ncbi:MAG TPA: acyl carrier protein [Actinomycetota bacterium]|nr:acyl carrier protein [Actinomycetota bacterium]
MNVEKQIRDYIQQELLEGAELGADPLAEGMLDSLAVEQLIGYIEDEFGVMFEDEELVAENFSSVEKVVSLVNEKLEAKTGA